jgi:predicted nucleic acid-binding protein
MTPESNQSPVFVLDSWPVLEWLKGREPASSAFLATLSSLAVTEGCFAMSRINDGEVIYMLHKDFPADEVKQVLAGYRHLPLLLYSVDDAHVNEAVAIKSKYPVSYADAFAAALSLRLDLPLVTADSELKRLAPLGLKLHWVDA